MKSILRNAYFIKLIGILVIAALNWQCKEAAVIQPTTSSEEVATTLKLEFTDTLTGQKLNYYYRDRTGIGQNNIVQWDTVRLFDSSYYSCSVKLLNEMNPNKIINLSDKILADARNYLFCFDGGSALTIKRTDSDGNFEIGLNSTWKTSSKTSGNILVDLRKQLNTKNGSCLPGTSELSVNFPFKISPK